MSQRSITLSLIALLAGAAAGAAMMTRADRPRAAPVTAAAVTTKAPEPAWHGVPEVYPAIPGATEADVQDESINSLGNVGSGS
jgi:hypothetical protein